MLEAFLNSQFSEKPMIMQFEHMYKYKNPISTDYIANICFGEIKMGLTRHLVNQLTLVIFIFI